jgi:hypothetical protein
MRMNCYQAAADPLAAGAQADLLDFLKAESLPFAAGL